MIYFQTNSKEKTVPEEANVEQLFIILIEFLMQSKRRVIELGAECELTATQTMMLFLLDKPQPMHNIKTIFNCDPSHVTGIVDGLEEKELAFRTDTPGDRRMKMIKLAPKGEQTRSALIKKLTVSDSPILATLNNEEASTFITLLKKITADYRRA